MWDMSYVNNMASAPVDVCLRFYSPFFLGMHWMKQIQHEDEGLTSYYSCVLNWEE